MSAFRLNYVAGRLDFYLHLRVVLFRISLSIIPSHFPVASAEVLCLFANNK